MSASTATRSAARHAAIDAEAVRAFLEPEGIAHDPLLLGDMAAAVERIRLPSSEANGSAFTATTTSTALRHGARNHDAAGALRGRRLAPPEQVRGRLRRVVLDGRAARRGRCGAHPHGGLRHHRGGGGRDSPPVGRGRDRHRPPPSGRDVADCPLVTTRPSDYPFPELCGTGVVVKLAQALLGADHPAISRHADLAALATIADVVPLVDENRALATPGSAALPHQKPGLQALMRSAGVDPATVDTRPSGSAWRRG